MIEARTGKAELELFEALVGLSERDREVALSAARIPTGLAQGVRELLAFHDLGSTNTWSSQGKMVPARIAVGARIEDRYEISRSLGAGGFGEVYLARDQISERSVAIKFLNRVPTSLVSLVRDEIAWLRTLALPAVPRLLDEGEHAGLPWFAMEFVEGLPFPGGAGPWSWDRLEPLAIELLDALAPIHASGLLHLDLKPSNVLVDGDGKVHLVDFGISVRVGSSTAQGSERALSGGTPPFSAPEQWTGDCVGPESDLHAIGVMLIESLAGNPDPSCLPESVPARVRQGLRLLIAESRSERPGDCQQALESLAGRRVLFAKTCWDSPLGLTGLFSGTDRILHENEDAAAALWRESRGLESRGREVIGRWIRKGIAVREGGGLVARRAALDDGLVRELMVRARKRDPSAQLHPARLADRLERRGWAARAFSLRIEALRSARRENSSTNRHAAARQLILAALRLHRATETDRVLQELAADRTNDGDIECWCRLLEVAAHANQGDGARALGELEALDRYPDPDLEAWRQTLIMRAAMSCGVDTLRSVHRKLATEPIRSENRGDLARKLNWTGLIAYHEANFESAARAHAASSELLSLPQEVLRAKLNAANAWLEALELDRCRELAARAGARAARYRLPLLEARAAMLERAARYRNLEPLEADPQFARIVATLGSTVLEARVLLIELAMAWRSGELDLAIDLAAESERAWACLGNPLVTALSRALGVACGATWKPQTLEHARAQVVEGRLPRVALQLEALLLEIGDSPLPGQRSRLVNLERPGSGHLRWEVFSFDELTERLTGRF